MINILRNIGFFAMIVLVYFTVFTLHIPCLLMCADYVSNAFLCGRHIWMIIFMATIQIVLISCIHIMKSEDERNVWLYVVVQFFRPWIEWSCFARDMNVLKNSELISDWPPISLQKFINLELSLKQSDYNVQLLADYSGG